MVMNYSADCNIFFSDFFERKMFFCLGAGWPRDTSEPAAHVYSMIYFHLNLIPMMAALFEFGVLLEDFTGNSRSEGAEPFRTEEQ